MKEGLISFFVFKKHNKDDIFRTFAARTPSEKGPDGEKVQTVI